MQHLRKKIKYDEIKSMPKRVDFINKPVAAIMEPAIRSHYNKSTMQKLYFMPNDIVEKDVSNFNQPKQYLVYCFGILPDGSKTCVIIENIPIFFDVRIPEGSTFEICKTTIMGILNNKHCDCDKLYEVTGYPLKGFCTKPQSYIRVPLKNTKDRVTAIHAVRKTLNTETAADDTSAYFNKTARELKYNTTGWNAINKSRKITKFGDKDHFTTNCQYDIYVDYDQIYGMDEKEIWTINTEFNTHIKDKDCLDPFIKDRTITCAWDIETYTFNNQTGEAPKAEDTNFNIFNICATFQYHYNKETILRVGIIDVPSNVPENADYLIEVADEGTALKAFIEVVGRMAPDILLAFNGGNFDWPLLREQALRKIKDNYGFEFGMRHMKQHLSSLPLSYYEKDLINKLENTYKVSKKPADYQLLKEAIEGSKTHNGDLIPGKIGAERNIHKWSFGDTEVKISAEEAAKLLMAKFSGIIDTDVMVTFKQLYPTAEVGRKSGLNFYLAKNKIESKEDMPYKHMFMLYEEAKKLASLDKCSCTTCDVCLRRAKSLDDMEKVVSYCITDSYRCHQLYQKRTIVDDRRQLSGMAYVTLFDGFYRANGMKVRNLIGAKALLPQFNIMFSNYRESGDKQTYPGGWVFPPRKGLNRKRPVVGLDYSSLYPSLMMAYNHSPDKSVDDPKIAEELIRQGYKLHHIDFNLDVVNSIVGNAPTKISGWVVRHNMVINSGDKPIIGYEKQNGKYVRYIGDKINDNGKLKPIYADREPLPRESMGLFPFILKWLFDFRAVLKKKFVALSKLREKMALWDGGIDTVIPDFVNNNDLMATEFEGKLDLFINSVKSHHDWEDLILEVEFWKNKVDSKQKAVKVFMNTFYGESGNNKSPIYKLLIAGGITSSGQYNIKLVANYMTERKYQVNYGDSVTPNTPVLCRLPDGTVQYHCIDELGNNWKHYEFDKEAHEPNIEVWSDKGFTKIKRVIRHKNTKSIYGILTNTGYVEVTSDHSLLDEYSQKIKPTDVTVGTKLLHADLPAVHLTASHNRQLNTATEFFNKQHDAIIVLDSDYKPHVKVINSEETDIIKQIIPLGIIDCYVYDLETDNHHFAAGVGRMIVHNTDSIYASCPETHFEELDKAFVAECKRIVEDESLALTFESKIMGLTTDTEKLKLLENARVKYWTEMVRLTQHDFSKLRILVGNMLAEDNGTEFLSMAYEEVLFPLVLAGKKKYGGYPHMDTVNFYPKIDEMFIRGLDFIKQGQTALAKKVGYSVMHDCCKPSCEDSLEDLVKAQVRRIYTEEWPLEFFKITAKYKVPKPGKPGNIQVQTFVKRMIERRKIYDTGKDVEAMSLYENLEPGDRFDYVVVKKDQTFNLKGNMVNLSVGDKMEFIKVYLASKTSTFPMEIDLNYYMDGAIMGIFSRFLVYKDEFQAADEITDYTERDKFAIKSASKYLSEYRDDFVGNSKNIKQQQGKDFKAIYRKVAKIAKEKIAETFSTESILFDTMTYDGSGGNNLTIDMLVEKAKGMATIDEHFGEKFIKTASTKVNFFKLRRLYIVNNRSFQGLCMIKSNIFNRMLANIKQELTILTPEINNLSKKYEKQLEMFVTDVRNNIEENDNIGDNVVNITTAETELIKKFNTLFRRFIMVHRELNYVKNIINAFDLATNKMDDAPEVNVIVNTKQIANNTQYDIINDYVFQ